MAFRTNLATNPRAVSTGTGWSNNTPATWDTAFVSTGVPVHPLGITTALEGHIKAGQVSAAAMSIYSPDSLLNTGPARRVGIWAYSVAAGYQFSGAYFPTTALAAATWTFIKTTSNIPLTQYTLAMISKVSGNAVSTDLVYMTGCVAEAGSVVGNYFDGYTNGLAAWTGTVNASTSTIYEPTLSAVADIVHARMEISVSGGKPGALAYVIRRDAQGSVLVRDTSTGIAIYDTSGSITGLFDYEARQGLSTNYILTDPDGLQVSATTLTIPNWGTWLKSPGMPFMNVKVLWGADSEYTRVARRELMNVRGAKFPTVHTDRRIAPSSTIRIVTETSSDGKALTSLLDGGGVLMIDVDAKFGVPVRYVSVGDMTGSRVGPNNKDLSWEARNWDLQINEVAAPIGLSAGQTLTYESIPAAFDSYIAVAASVATYEDLAAGNW